MKALGLRPRAFICFSVFGTRDKALALVFDILLTVFNFRPPYVNTNRKIPNRDLGQITFSVFFLCVWGGVGEEFILFLEGILRLRIGWLDGTL